MITSGTMEPHEVDDFDFIFVNGFVFPITVDYAAGDTINFGEREIEIHIHKKPLLAEGNTLDTTEHTILNRNNILIINHRVRTVLPQSPEQRDQFSMLIKQKTGKTIH